MSDRGRRTTTVAQIEILLNFLENHRDLALGRTRSKEFKELSHRLWEQIAVRLNAEGPAERSAKEWSKFWNDYKCRVRTKLVACNKSRSGTGGGPAIQLALSPLEERVGNIIGRDFGPIPGVHMHSFMDNNNDENAEGGQHDHDIPVDNAQDLEVILQEGHDSSLFEERRQEILNIQLLDHEYLPRPAPVNQPTENLPQTPHDHQATPPRASALVSQSRDNISQTLQRVEPPDHQMMPPQAPVNPARENMPRTPQRGRPRGHVNRIRVRRPPVPGAAHAMHIHNLEQSRAAVVRIEEARARNDAAMGAAMTSIAASLHLMARAMNRLSRRRLHIHNLEQSRAAVVRIEEARARNDAAMGAAMTTIAASLHLMARAMNILSRRRLHIHNLEKSRAAVVRIEEARARNDAAMGAAMTTIAASLHLMARAMNILSRRRCKETILLDATCTIEIE